MDLDGRAYSKIFEISYNDVKFEEYRRIIDIIWFLTKSYNHKISGMWCVRIYNLFRKILEKNSRILSKNRYISVMNFSQLDDCRS